MNKTLKFLTFVFVIFIVTCSDNAYAFATSCYKCIMDGNSEIFVSSGQASNSCTWVTDERCPQTCHRCNYNGREVYKYSSNIDMSEINQGFCSTQSVDLSYCVPPTGITGGEVKCVYKNGNDKLTISFNIGLRVISSFNYNGNNISYKGISYDTFADESNKSEPVNCSKYEKLCINKKSSPLAVNFFGPNGCSKGNTKFELDKNASANSITTNAQYCLYKPEENMNLVASGDDAKNKIAELQELGNGKVYEYVTVFVDINTGSVITNAGDVLPTGSSFNPQKSEVLNSDNSCKSSIKYKDEIGNDNPTENIPTPKPPIDWDDPASVNCDGIIGQDMLDFIHKIFTWIRIVVPIIVIVLSSVDFASALLQDDKDAEKKAINKLVKRLIIAVAIFFVPVIIEFVLRIFNQITGSSSSTCIGR